MRVRVTERLIGDVVIASGIPNSPLMVVRAIDEQTKTVTTIWFSDRHECEEGQFPASALERFEPPPAKVQPPKTAKEKSVPGRRGRKPSR